MSEDEHVVEGGRATGREIVTWKKQWESQGAGRYTAYIHTYPLVTNTLMLVTQLAHASMHSLMLVCMLVCLG